MAPRGPAAGRAGLSIHTMTAAREGSSMGDHNRSHHQYERVVVSAEGGEAREIRIYGHEA